ncbi:MAG: hypothetical protein FJX47_00510 [Alphaproteobacteria bacterium]|nr:hypothetical protein [Alphaproteobacteria bacterium]
MRIRSFFVKKTDNVDNFEGDGLSDVIVLAGPNGVGKTRIVRALIDFFRDPQAGPKVGMVLDSTSDSEKKAWRKESLNTSIAEDASKLRGFLQRSQKRNNYQSTILNFDSDRSIQNIGRFDFSWDVGDPFAEDVGWDVSYRFLRDRFQDVTHSLYRLVETQRRSISDRALDLRKEGAKTMNLDFPDPLEKFKAAFEQLLPGKRMIEASAKTQQITYEHEGKILPITSLSSGEREVVNIVFDFILRNPSDCIVIFDEPELHLHPELSYRLLQALAAIGKNNQFIFCTHSPEIITASIENSVIFVTPKKPDSSNQAILVNRDDETHHALNLLGQSIGIISLGKKLLLIEGDESSLDKQTYGAIIRNEFPELVLVPVGGKGKIFSFNEIHSSILNRTIWGVEFFMLCDRDAVYNIGPVSIEKNRSDRLKVLKRYHLENYFLDPLVMTKIFEDMEPSDSWVRDQGKVFECIREIARETVPYGVALKIAALMRERIGNVDVMPKGAGSSPDVDALVKLFQNQAQGEVLRVQTNLNLSELESLAKQEYSDLMESINNNTDRWSRELPGRVLLNRFSGKVNMKVGRLKNLYLRYASASTTDPFDEIREIFRSLRKTATQ